MKLYGHPFSSNARRVHMLCEECSIPYQYETIDLMKGDQFQPSFLELNPNGMVPVIDDDGFVLWESQAIMRYLANKHGASTWYPSEPRIRAQIDAWLDWNHTRLGRETEDIVLNMLILGDKGEKHKIEESKQALTNILPILEKTLSAHSYICGNQPTLVDLAFLPNIAALEMCRQDLSEYTSISAWYNKMKNRKSFQATSPQ